MDYRPNFFPAYLAGFRNILGALGQDVAFDWIAMRSNAYDTAGDRFTRHEILKVTHVIKQNVTETLFEYQCKCAHNHCKSFAELSAINYLSGN